MPDWQLVAGWLLVLGPIVGLIPVSYPPLLRIWTAPRDVHLSTVAAHRTAWAWLNAGFAAATLTTTIGLALVAAVALGRAGWFGYVTLGVAIAYGAGGGAWLAVLAIRTRTTPLLGEMIATGRDPAPAEDLLAAATGGLFALFTVVTAGALVVLGISVAAAGGAALVVGIVAAGVAVASLASQLRTGDSIPALLYVPTLLVGVSIVAGWR